MFNVKESAKRLKDKIDNGKSFSTSELNYLLEGILITDVDEKTDDHVYKKIPIQTWNEIIDRSNELDSDMRNDDNLIWSQTKVLIDLLLGIDGPKNFTVNGRAFLAAGGKVLPGTHINPDSALMRVITLQDENGELEKALIDMDILVKD